MTDSLPAAVSNETTGAIVLASRLTTDEAVKLCQTILANESPEVVIDAGSVQFLGAAGLQVLMAAAKSAERDGKGFLISDPSQDFVACLNRLGADLSDLTIDKGAQCH